MVWWVAIAGIMVGVGVAGAFPEERIGINALGGAAALLVVVLHELLPNRWRGRISATIEVLGALVLATGLIRLTGGNDSPFVFVYHVVAVAAALTIGATLALAVAAAATIGFLGVVLLDAAGARSERHVACGRSKAVDVHARDPGVGYASGERRSSHEWSPLADGHNSRLNRASSLRGAGGPANGRSASGFWAMIDSRARDNDR